MAHHKQTSKQTNQKISAFAGEKSNSCWKQKCQMPITPLYSLGHLEVLSEDPKNGRGNGTSVLRCCLNFFQLTPKSLQFLKVQTSMEGQQQLQPCYKGVRKNELTCNPGRRVLPITCKFPQRIYNRVHKFTFSEGIYAT